MGLLGAVAVAAEEGKGAVGGAKRRGVSRAPSRDVVGGDVALGKAEAGDEELPALLLPIDLRRGGGVGGGLVLPLLGMRVRPALPLSSSSAPIEDEGTYAGSCPIDAEVPTIPGLCRRGPPDDLAL